MNLILLAFLVFLFVLLLALVVVMMKLRRENEIINRQPLLVRQLQKTNADFLIPYKEITLGTLLGKGSQGEVYRGLWRGSPVAVKKVDTRQVDNDIIQEFCQEADIMRRLRHPSLTLFLGLSLEHPHLCILSEIVSRGSLFDIIHDDEAPLTFQRALTIATDIAAGLTYLHAHKPPILHRDLKSLNILVDENWRGKVADLGMARFADKTNQTMTQCGSPLWMSPEMIKNAAYDEKCDVYSFGICLWELYTRRIPYRELGLTPSQLVVKVVKEQLRPPIPPSCPKLYARLMERCWHRQGDRRPNFKQVLTVLETMKRDAKMCAHRPMSMREVLVVREEREEEEELQAEGPGGGEHENAEKIEKRKDKTKDKGKGKIGKSNGGEGGNPKKTKQTKKNDDTLSSGDNSSSNSTATIDLDMQERAWLIDRSSIFVSDVRCCSASTAILRNCDTADVAETVLHHLLPMTTTMNVNGVPLLSSAELATVTVNGITVTNNTNHNTNMNTMSRTNNNNNNNNHTNPGTLVTTPTLTESKNEKMKQTELHEMKKKGNKIAPLPAVHDKRQDSLLRLALAKNHNQAQNRDGVSISRVLSPVSAISQSVSNTANSSPVATQNARTAAATLNVTQILAASTALAFCRPDNANSKHSNQSLMLVPYFWEYQIVNWLNGRKQAV